MKEKVIAIAFTLVIILGLGGCISACSGGSSNSSSSSSSSSDSSSSSLSKDEQGRRAAENEASHYHYDKSGHIYDDRKK